MYIQLAQGMRTMLRESLRSITAKALKVPSAVRFATTTPSTIRYQLTQIQQRSSTERAINPLTDSPRSYWSQADEDGIIEQIFARLDPIENSTFIELGVGNGAECNSLALLAKGWRGLWISAQSLCFVPHPNGRLTFVKDFIDRSNIVALVDQHASNLGGRSPSLFSVDLDGNDYHIVETLLAAGAAPLVWVVEYNATFPPEALWTMAYDSHHRWRDDDYFGASLRSFSELMAAHGYVAVACSSQGANCFFVAEQFKERFTDVPTRLSDLYRPPEFGLRHLGRGKAHRASPRTLTSLTNPV